MIELTKEDIRNGWSLEAKRAYLKERDEAACIGAGIKGNIVGGNIVTEFKRNWRPPIRHESAIDFNPHKWGRSR